MKPMPVEELRMPPTEAQVAELCSLAGPIARRLAFQRDSLRMELEAVKMAYGVLGGALDAIRKGIHSLPDEQLAILAPMCRSMKGPCWCGCHISEVCREDDQPEPDTCCECNELAVGYADGYPWCAAHYAGRPLLSPKAPQ